MLSSNLPWDANQHFARDPPIVIAQGASLSFQLRPLEIADVVDMESGGRGQSSRMSAYIFLLYGYMVSKICQTYVRRK